MLQLLEDRVQPEGVGHLTPAIGEELSFRSRGEQFGVEKLIPEAALGGSARKRQDQDLFLAALAILRHDVTALWCYGDALNRQPMVLYVARRILLQLLQVDTLRTNWQPDQACSQSPKRDYDFSSTHFTPCQNQASQAAFFPLPAALLGPLAITVRRF
jgi:hypothetical protein